MNGWDILNCFIFATFIMALVGSCAAIFEHELKEADRRKRNKRIESQSAAYRWKGRQL